MKASSVDRLVGPDPAQSAVVLRVRLAHQFFARARGLIGQPPPARGCGLLLWEVATVHGIGMHHCLDLLFLDDEGAVVECAHLAPGRIGWCRGARHVLEMRAGEIARLGLGRGMRPRIVRVDDIFTGASDPPVDSARRMGQARGGPLAGFALAACLVVPAPHGTLHAASPAGSTSAPGELLAPISLTRPLAAQTLQQLEDEAEARYRDDRPRLRGDPELIRLYESLAELREDRATHAWLRIGNIHQRSGSVGAAIDAYRRTLSADTDSRGAGAAASDTAAADAERKALINLAALALDQARQSLARLEAMAGAAGPYSGQLQSLERRLAGVTPRDDPAAADAIADARHVPYLVERYTASARRNAVKSARGSLHLDPADGSPARQIAKPPARPLVDVLPRVEYLLGDPSRSKQAIDAQGVPDGKPAAAGRSVTPRRPAEPAGKRGDGVAGVDPASGAARAK